MPPYRWLNFWPFILRLFFSSHISLRDFFFFMFIYLDLVYFLACVYFLQLSSLAWPFHPNWMVVHKMRWKKETTKLRILSTPWSCCVLNCNVRCQLIKSVYKRGISEAFHDSTGSIHQLSNSILKSSSLFKCIRCVGFSLTQSLSILKCNKRKLWWYILLLLLMDKGLKPIMACDTK